MKTPLLPAAILLAWGAFAQAQTVPAAIFTDPPLDKAHPASSQVLHIPSGGVEINGLAYLPAGPGPYPVLLIAHGLPGNEKNLDLAQAVRRAGWAAITFNYRGSWGSPGKYSFAGDLKDADAVLAYLRNPANAARLHIDPTRIAMAGHSLGGWVTVQTAAHDHVLLGAAIISAADMSRPRPGGRDAVVAMMADNLESLNTTAGAMADEVPALASTSFATAVPGLRHTNLLVLTSDDGLAPANDALVAAIKAAGGDAPVTVQHELTDHGWSDRRIALEAAVITWLQTLK